MPGIQGGDRVHGTTVRAAAPVRVRLAREALRRALRCVAAVLVAGLVAACTDLQVSSRLTAPASALPAAGTYRFARAPLAGDTRISATARAGDAAARAAIARELERRGLAPGETDAALLVDFTLRDGIGVNSKRLDGPSDYRRSWRSGPAGDGTGTMDHMVADSAFRRDLELTVLLMPAATGKSAWEGRVSRSVAPDYPDEALGDVLERMSRPLFTELDRARSAER